MTLFVRLALGTYMLALGWVAFAPAQDAGRVTELVSVLASWIAWWSELPFAEAYLLLEFLANVALFLPFGVLWALATPRLHSLAVVGMGLATSTVIEVVQLILPSRFSSVSDVIANTLGTAFGVSIVVLVGRAGRRIAPPVPQRI